MKTQKEQLSDLSNIFNNTSNLDEIIHSLNNASSILKELQIAHSMKNDPNMTNVVMSGLTGAGKTTLSHYLEGHELYYKKDQDRSKKLFISYEDEFNRQIGNNKFSTTFFPNIFTIKDIENHQIIDTAGLWDNNGIFVQIANAWIIDQLITQYKTAKFFIVTDYRELELAKGQPFIEKMQELLGKVNNSNFKYSFIMSHASEDMTLENEEKYASEEIIKIVKSNHNLLTSYLNNSLEQNAHSLAFFCKPDKLGEYNIPGQKEKIIKLIQNAEESNLDNFFKSPIVDKYNFIEKLKKLGIESNKSFIETLLDRDLDSYIKNNIKKLELSNLNSTLDLYKKGDIRQSLNHLKKSFIDNYLSTKTIDYELSFIESLQNIEQYFRKGEITEIINSHKTQLISKADEVSNILHKIMNGDEISHSLNNQIFTIKSPYITSEQINNHVNKQEQKNIKQIEVYSGAISFNQDIKFPGKNLVIVTKNYSVNPELNQKSTSYTTRNKLVVEKDSAYDAMNDKNYWYNETDIQYIANGLITGYNVTPALGASENRTLQQLLEGALEEYKTHYEPTFIPLNIRGNHWVAFSIFKHEGSEYAFYKDSLGAIKYKEEREQVEQIIKKYNPDIIFQYHTGHEQKDSSSCGIFALQNMKIMSDKLADKEKFITDFTEEIFTNQHQTDQLRKGEFSQLYKEQLQYNNKVREAIRDNHYPELEKIKNILGESQYKIKALTKKESLNSSTESNTLGIDIILSHNINKGEYQYNYVITATKDCKSESIINLVSEKLKIDKSELIQSTDNKNTITINKNLLQIDTCDVLSNEKINQKIQLQESDSNLPTQSNQIHNSTNTTKKKIVIDLSGEHGKILDSDQSTYGEHALHGKHGMHSGNFLFIKNKADNFEKIFDIKLDGGNGSNGQKGYSSKSISKIGGDVYPINQSHLIDIERQFADLRDFLSGTKGNGKLILKHKDTWLEYGCCPCASCADKRDSLDEKKFTQYSRQEVKDKGFTLEVIDSTLLSNSLLVWAASRFANQDNQNTDIYAAYSFLFNLSNNEKIDFQYIHHHDNSSVCNGTSQILSIYLSLKELSKSITLPNKEQLVNIIKHHLHKQDDEFFDSIKKSFGCMKTLLDVAQIFTGKEHIKNIIINKASSEFLDIDKNFKMTIAYNSNNISNDFNGEHRSGEGGIGGKGGEQGKFCVANFMADKYNYVSISNANNGLEGKKGEDGMASIVSYPIYVFVPFAVNAKNNSNISPFMQGKIFNKKASELELNLLKTEEQIKPPALPTNIEVSLIKDIPLLFTDEYHTSLMGEEDIHHYNDEY